jgi:hypothetical protein
VEAHDASRPAAARGGTGSGWDPDPKSDPTLLSGSGPSTGGPHHLRTGHQEGAPKLVL